MLWSMPCSVGDSAFIEMKFPTNNLVLADRQEEDGTRADSALGGPKARDRLVVAVRPSNSFIQSNHL